jgi:hypothetical protein
VLVTFSLTSVVAAVVAAEMAVVVDAVELSVAAAVLSTGD